MTEKLIDISITKNQFIILDSCEPSVRLSNIECIDLPNSVVGGLDVPPAITIYLIYLYILQHLCQTPLAFVWLIFRNNEMP